MPFDLPPVDPAAFRDVPADVLSPELLASLLVDGDDELAAWTLRNAMASSSRAEVFDGLVRDAMRMVGENWRAGRWSIADEHLASRTLLAVLEQIRPATTPASRVGPLAVLAGVAGEHHMIGLVCLEQILIEDGWTVANLGSDMPDTDLANFVARNSSVAMVALTASGVGRVEALAEAVVAIRVAGGARPLAILIGGGISYEPGMKERTGADGVAVLLTDAQTFAARHRPADS